MWKELPLKLWDLANAITAFSVAQVIAYLYLLSNKTVVDNIDWWLKPIIIAFIFIFHALYLYGICWCHGKMLALEPKRTRKSFGAVGNKVKRGQMVVVFLFAIVALGFTVFGIAGKQSANPPFF